MWGQNENQKALISPSHASTLECLQKRLDFSTNSLLHAHVAQSYHTATCAVCSAVFIQEPQSCKRSSNDLAQCFTSSKLQKGGNDLLQCVASGSAQGCCAISTHAP